SETRRSVKLEFDVEKLDAARLEAIVQHLQKLLDDGSIKLRRIEEGCMELIFDGSQKSLEKLDALFKSGELAEILGIPVQDVRNVDFDISLDEIVVSLSQWLQNVIGAGWQTVEEVLGTQKANLVFATRSILSVESVVRAKQINLEIPGSENSLGLVVAVIPKSTDGRDIHLQVHSSSSKTLPQGLKCVVLDISGKNLFEVKAKNNDRWIQLGISGQVGEQFSVQIQMGDANTTQNFVI
ncbi:MAG: DUF1822 family protein, partial [Rhizonema sp. PD38]|nr:DUF1822 family protein [Rhizonema sp. PD38]